MRERYQPPPRITDETARRTENPKLSREERKRLIVAMCGRANALTLQQDYTQAQRELDGANGALRAFREDLGDNYGLNIHYRGAENSYNFAEEKLRVATNGAVA